MEITDQKIENLLNVSLLVSDSLREKSPQLNSGVDDLQGIWEIIVRYTGDITFLKDKYEGLTLKMLINRYAVIRTPKRFIEDISKESQIIYVEKPKPLYFELAVSKAVSCIDSVTRNSAVRGKILGLSGENTIVAVIDTGIDASLKEFRNTDGTTRILNIYDQSENMEYNSEQINKMIGVDSTEQIKVIGRDITGHGTNVAIIACGNSGVASGAQIIVVKLGIAGKNTFPRTTQLMDALDYVIRKSEEYNKPVAVNISFGNNYGSHSGNSLLETYIDSICDNWKCSICIGTGNEGLGATHASGILKEGINEIVEIAVNDFETSLSVQIWKGFWDEISVEIISPTGESLGILKQSEEVRKLFTDETQVLAFYGQASPYSISQEIYLDLLPVNEYILAGTWKIRLIPEKIKNGRYDMWLPAVSSLNFNTGFTKPDSNYTFTIPSTAAKSISVGAYNPRTLAVSSFSGRGYVINNGGNVVSKPDILAPGENVIIPGIKNESVTGTSFATPFVTGSAALLMEWGIVRGNDPYLYGEKLKAYFIAGAKKLPDQKQIPNGREGWGTLCVSSEISI